MLHLDLPESMYAKLVNRSKAENLSLNELVIALLSLALSQENRAPSESAIQSPGSSSDDSLEHDL